jgi:hypothetical protein
VAAVTTYAAVRIADPPGRQPPARSRQGRELLPPLRGGTSPWTWWWRSPAPRRWSRPTPSCRKRRLACATCSPAVRGMSTGQQTEQFLPRLRSGDGIAADATNPCLLSGRISGAAEQGYESDEAFGGIAAGKDMPPHARAGPYGRGHRFAAYPRCWADSGGLDARSALWPMPRTQLER